jgi:hypothetical protein
MERKGKLIHTTWEGRTVVDANLLLRDPKVQQTIARLSELNKPLRDRPGFRFLRLSKTPE